MRRAPLWLLAGVFLSATAAAPLALAAESAADPAASKQGIAANVALPAIATVPLRELIVGVQSGGRLIADFESVLSDGAGRFLVTADLLSVLQLKPPAGVPRTLRGISYYALQEIPGVAGSFDSAEQVLTISVPASSLIPTTIDISNRRPVKPETADTGLFVNHDIEVSGSGAHYGVSGVEEVGIFSKLGLFTTRMLARHVANTTRFTRLDSQFVRDFPNRMATLTIGDAVSAPSAWGRSIYYAGVRWASNFETQSSFIPYALPALSGEAARPSTVDLYVNNVRTGSQSVNAGPFTVRNIPTLTTQGDVRMVITDITGRQQVVEAPYISAPQLLRKGISGYAYEAGAARTDYGTRDARYGSPFLSASHRRGLTDSLTIDLRAELQGSKQAGGVGVDAGVMRFGVVGAGSVVSRDHQGRTGVLIYAHLQHITRGLGFSLSSRAATKNFWQLGQLAGEHGPRFSGQAQVSWSIGRRATVSTAYVLEERSGSQLQDRNGIGVSRFSAVSPALTLNLGRRCFLVASGSYAPKLGRPVTAMLSLIIPLGSRRTQSATAAYEGSQPTTSVDFAQQLPVGTGWGYRVRTTAVNGFSSDRTDVGVTYQSTAAGSYRMEAGRQAGAPTDWRLSYSGSAVLMRGQLMFGREVSDGFAVVDAAGAAGMEVLANNQYIGKTNGRGLVLVPNLPAYSESAIGLDEGAAPMNLDADFEPRKIVPMRRTGVFVELKAQRARGAMLKLVTESGAEIPVGARATVNGGAQIYETVLHGELYVPEISFPAVVVVQWATNACQARVAAPKNPDEVLPLLGPIVCWEAQ